MEPNGALKFKHGEAVEQATEPLEVVVVPLVGMRDPVLFALVALTWLKRLYACPLTSAASRSVKLNFLETRKSTTCVRGSRKVLRPMTSMPPRPPEPLIPLDNPPGALPEVTKEKGNPLWAGKIGGIGRPLTRIPTA